MGRAVLATQAPPVTPASGLVEVYPAANKLLSQKDAGKVTTLGGIRNANTADVTANAADTYLTGSSLPVPAHLLQVGTQFRWRIWMTKTAAGVATPVWSVRVGTAGTTSDSARLAFTGPAQTAATDVGYVTIDAVVRSIGASGVVAGVLVLSHNTSGATGFAAAASPVIQVTSSGFDMTVANLVVGVSVNPGSAGVWTHQGVLGEMNGI